MKPKKVTKEQFDTFLNYFQDKYIFKSLFGTTVYLDTYDMNYLAELKLGEYYIYD